MKHLAEQDAREVDVDAMERAVDELLRVLRQGLVDAAHKKAGSYSKGMKQRLVFARALINRPRLLFLDEPTSGLDPNIAGTIKNIIQQKQAEGITIFLTTPNMFIPHDLCDRVAFINDGRNVALETPRNLKLQFGSRAVKVEYANGQGVDSAVFFLDNAQVGAAYTGLVNNEQVQTMHTQEATLEQNFVKVTGRRRMGEWACTLS
jgi:fluoroquinolone transport system ATP-binding protein